MSGNISSYGGIRQTRQTQNLVLRNKGERSIRSSYIIELLLSKAEEFGVSDQAISKWCKCYGISKPPRGYWAKLNSKKNVSE